MYPVIPHHDMKKDVPGSVQIYQYDTSPTAGRLPLLIVPGRNDERYRYFHMHKICQYFDSDPRFKQRYKIFLFRYNTLAPQRNTESQFKVAIRQLAKEQGHAVSIVAPSIAGNMVRRAIADPMVDPSVVRLITLGSPFHGSPLFNRDWIIPSLMAHHSWPVRIARGAAFGAFFKRNDYLLKNYHWDNFDGQEPSQSNDQAGGDGEDVAALPPSKPPLGATAAEPGDKVIAYAGYIDNDKTEGIRKRRLPVISQVVDLFRTTVPGFLGRQHPMLRYLNREIARVPVKDEAKGDYAFNDGIVPISSSLSLSASGPADADLKSAESFEQLKSKIGVQRARLFPNIDHVTFLYGTGPAGRNADIPDKLSPEEKPRPIFAWMLSDLLDATDGQLSAGKLPNAPE